MDVALLSPDSIRVKGKNSTIIVNPSAKISKTEADGIINLDKTDFSDEKIEGSRITVKGPGEYEVGGVKISAVTTNSALVSRIDVDSVKVIIGNGEALEKIQDRIEGCDLLVVNADKKFNYSALASLEPKVLLVYGELKEEVSKSMGKTSVEKLNKFSATADKLPSEPQFISLG